MFENEYLVDSKRYCKWMTPIFYMHKIFYIYLFVFIMGGFGYWYFTYVKYSARWKTMGIFLMFIAVYRGIFFRWMKSNKQYRVMKQQYFDDKPWTNKIVVSNTCIEIFVNGKSNNKIYWGDIKEFREAKSYFNLSTGVGRDGVMLEKDSFIKGSVADFKKYMLESHKEIPYREEEKKYNR